MWLKEKPQQNHLLYPEKKDPCILGISFQRKSLGFKTLPIGIVNATWSKYSAKELLWRPTKAKRYFIAHQLFKWSIEVMKNISLISASIDSENTTSLQDLGFSEVLKSRVRSSSLWKTPPCQATCNWIQEFTKAVIITFFVWFLVFIHWKLPSKER